MQVPQEECVRKYKVPGAAVHVLQEEASRFAGMVAAFCERLGWVDLEALITKFQVGSNRQAYIVHVIPW